MPPLHAGAPRLRRATGRLPSAVRRAPPHEASGLRRATGSLRRASPLPDTWPPNLPEGAPMPGRLANVCLTSTDPNPRSFPADEFGGAVVRRLIAQQLPCRFGSGFPSSRRPCSTSQHSSGPELC